MTWPLIRYHITYEIFVEAPNSALAEYEAVKIMESDPLRLRRVRITSLGRAAPSNERHV